MWCWRRLENITWADHVRTGKGLQRVKKERNILKTIKRRKGIWIGPILHRNWLLRHVIEGRIYVCVGGRRGRRREHLLDVLKEKSGYRQLKEEALDRAVLRTRFRRSDGPVVRQTTEWINPLSPELNPISYLLALVGAHHFLHVSGLGIKLLTFRLLMSYIYGAPIFVVSRSHKTTQHSR